MTKFNSEKMAMAVSSISHYLAKLLPKTASK